MSELDDELAQVERTLEAASARRQDTWRERPRGGVVVCLYNLCNAVRLTHGLKGV